MPVRRAQQLGRYHLLDRIAFGGMAEILRAKTFDAHGQPHLDAVKRVLAHLAEDDDFIQMLVDEAKIASVLRHTNIARVYEFARAHGEYFIAMEHVDGKDMRTVLERCRAKKKPVPPEHAAYVAAEISSALHAAHSAVDGNRRPLRIVHRDLSPAVPPELEAICERCLTRSRAHRYQTAAEVEADLRSFLRKYMPNYSRSHLGRFIRKMFASEIERELRMLEEFVLADVVSDDVGENLIAPDPDYQPPPLPLHPQPP